MISGFVSTLAAAAGVVDATKPGRPLEAHCMKGLRWLSEGSSVMCAVLGGAGFHAPICSVFRLYRLENSILVVYVYIAAY